MTTTGANPIGTPVVVRHESAVDGNACRLLVGQDTERRTDPLVWEWELTRSGWEDRHPHTETTYVLEGRLHVESGGTEVVLGPGDCVVVPAGSTGRYWAPDHARMLAVYGPNPDGTPTPPGRAWEVQPDRGD